MNFHYAAVNTLYLLALNIWIVGEILMALLILPRIFKSLPDQVHPSEIADAFMERFAKTKWTCLGILFFTSLVKLWAWEQPTPWILLRYAAILIMATIYMGRVTKRISFSVPVAYLEVLFAMVALFFS
ncbi:MAG: hypothetical protein HY402_04270 [Elusimicrobia bacterium]|nr:hypothetical protein [Elusimicrobiota bacterium]